MQRKFFDLREPGAKALDAVTKLEHKVNALTDRVVLLEAERGLTTDAPELGQDLAFCECPNCVAPFEGTGGGV